MDRLLEKQGNLQERIDALGLWELDHKLDIAMDALRLPPGDADVDDALRRRAPPRRALPAAARRARHAAARRAHQPPRRRERLVARAVPGGVPGHRRRRHARPLLPGQRGRAGSSSSTRARAFRGRATTPRWLEQKRSAGSPGGEAGLGPAEDAAARARVGADVAAGAAGQEQGAHHAVRGAAGRGGAADRGHGRDPDPRARAAGRGGRDRQGRRQGVRRPAAVREPDLLAAARRHRRRDRPQRRGQDDAVPHDHRPGEARQRHAHGRHDGAASPTWTRAATRSMADKTVYEEISGGQDQLQFGKPQGERAGLLPPASTSAGADQQKKVGTSPAASGTGSTWPSCSRAAATCCCSTSRPTTSTWTRCARWRRRCSASPAARWSSATTAGSSTASRPTSWRSRATARSVWFEGNYADYAADLKRRKGVDANQPHRIRYKKLVH